MNLAKAKPLVFHEHNDADVLRVMAEGVLIPTVVAFVTTGDGAYAVIYQAKAKRKSCHRNRHSKCFEWPLKADLLKGKVDPPDVSAFAALAREVFEEGQLNLKALKISPRFQGWIKVPSKLHKHGSFKGLECKLWLVYQLIVPSRDCLKSGSHGVVDIRWPTDLPKAFKKGSAKRQAVAEIMQHLQKKPRLVA